MQCPKCRHENRKGAKFCGQCGHKFEIVCPECETRNPAGNKFCDECGHTLEKTQEAPAINYSEPQSYTPKHLTDKILTHRSAIEGERKLVTVLFADVANYTRISENLDPEKVHQIMDVCFKILMDEVHRYEGAINQFTGDGVMALFGAPVSHEDHAQRACHAALSIQKAMAAYRTALAEESGIEFKMRIGINTGKVIVGAIGDDLRMDYTAVGDATNLAARIQQTAEPGEAWLSHHTQSIIEGFFQVESVSNRQLKGIAEKQSIYKLLGEHKAVRTRFEAGLARGVTDLVGRQPEMQILNTAWGRASSGEARIVDIVGEAGVGKSRLIYEFQKSITDKATILTGVCIHYGLGISYLPLIDIVRSAFGIEEGMSEEEAGHCIREKASGNLGKMIPFYQNLLSLKVDEVGFKSLNPESRKFGTFEAVKNLLFSISKSKPLVIFIEDAHWIDKISEAFFVFFSHAIKDQKILVLSAYRPEAKPEWAKGPIYRQLGLETLGEKPSRHLIRNILGGLDLDPDVEKMIVAKTGGNPFFVEEMVRELVERNELIQEERRYTLRNPIGHLVIPETIQGTIAARMDRLSDDLKRTMQVASVIGRDFAYKILRSIMELGDDLRMHLTHLVGLEVLYEKALYPELEYIFKHALTQEVAYESLLKQRRREIHNRIAKAVENLYARQLKEHYELLAYHYERSGNQAKAVDYLILSGVKSNKQGAAQAAYEFLDTAFEIAAANKIDLDPEKRIRLYQGRAEASFSIGDIEKCVADYKKAIDLSRQNNLIKYERQSISGLTFLMYLWPAKAEAEKFFADGITRARELQDKALESSILAGSGIRAAMDGQPYQGNQIIKEAEQKALELGEPGSIVYTRVSRAVTERWIGRPQKTIDMTEGVVELANEMFNVSSLIYVISFRGLALAETGRIEDAISVIQYGIDVSEKFGVSIRLGCLYNTLGYCYGEIYQTERALGFNLKGEKVARALMEKFPMGRRQSAEMVAHSCVNKMENLFDQGNLDHAWNLMNSFAEETKSDDFDMFRLQWESRMYYLAAQILLERGDIDQAESFIQRYLRKSQKRQMRKREGCFLRLLGELLIKRNNFENGIENLNKAIEMLKDVANPRQLWQSYASLASAYHLYGRSGEARENWRTAAEVIHGATDLLSDREMKKCFLRAEPIHGILSKAEK